MGKNTKRDTFNRKLERLLKCKIFNDVTFNCKDGKIQGNRLILSIYSSLLRNLFNSTPLLTSHPVYSHPENGIVLLESSVDDVNNLLDLINCRKPLELGLDQYQGVKQIAKEFEIKLVSGKCGPRKMVCRPVMETNKKDDDDDDSDDIDQGNGNLSEDMNSEDELENGQRKYLDSDEEEEEDGLDDDFSSDFRPYTQANYSGYTSRRGRARSASSTPNYGRSRKVGRPRSSEKDKEMDFDTEKMIKPHKKHSSTKSHDSIEKMFLSQNYFTIESNGGSRVFQCKACPKFYDNQSKIRNHFQVKHLNLSFNCVKCGEQFEARYKVVKHIQNIHKIFDGLRHYYRHEIATK